MLTQKEYRVNYHGDREHNFSLDSGDNKAPRNNVFYA